MQSDKRDNLLNELAREVEVEPSHFHLKSLLAKARIEDAFGIVAGNFRFKDHAGQIDAYALSARRAECVLDILEVADQLSQNRKAISPISFPTTGPLDLDGDRISRHSASRLSKQGAAHRHPHLRYTPRGPRIPHPWSLKP